MKDTLKKAIEALIKRAEENDQVFVLGDEVYTPEEALDAFLAHADEEIAYHEWTEDEYIDHLRDCLADKED